LDPSKNLTTQQNKKESNRWSCVVCTHVAFQGGLFDSFEIDIHVGVGGVAIVRVQGHLWGDLFGEKPRIFEF